MAHQATVAKCSVGEIVSGNNTFANNNPAALSRISTLELLLLLVVLVEKGDWCRVDEEEEEGSPMRRLKRWRRKSRPVGRRARRTLQGKERCQSLVSLDMPACSVVLVMVRG